MWSCLSALQVEQVCSRVGSRYFDCLLSYFPGVLVGQVWLLFPLLIGKIPWLCAEVFPWSVRRAGIVVVC
jgi:hypothetical protein